MEKGERRDGKKRKERSRRSILLKVSIGRWMRHIFWVAPSKVLLSAQNNLFKEDFDFHPKENSSF